MSVSTSGFTLLELLVALIIIGVMVASIQLNLFKDDARRVREEAERVAALLSALQDEAITSGHPLAVTFTRHTYIFWQRNDSQGWQPMQADSMFSPRAFAHDIQLTAWRIQGKSTEHEEKLIFSPDGMAPNFFLTLSLGDWHASLTSDGITHPRVELRAQATEEEVHGT